MSHTKLLGKVQLHQCSAIEKPCYIIMNKALHTYDCGTYKVKLNP